ncbi:MAG: tRNA (adenosine(37)-N6)-threonylcarbamoyltransferase complex dimerization subunit type 1 TsaB [Vulcanimicrobiota bacterium]
MNILLIDSTTEVFSVSLAKDDRLLGESFFELPRGHLVNLIPLMTALLKTCRTGFSDISMIGVTNGPGSFTGVRLGVMTARTVGQLCDVPIVPVNTLDVLAMNCLYSEGTVCSMLDARKNEIFSALYRQEGSTLRRLSDYRVHNPEGLVEDLNRCGAPLILTGNALSRYGGLLKDAMKEKVIALPPSYWYPRGNSLLHAVLDALRSSNGVRYHEVRAFYMRDSEAEETKKSCKTK